MNETDGTLNEDYLTDECDVVDEALEGILRDYYFPRPSHFRVLYLRMSIGYVTFH